MRAISGAVAESLDSENKGMSHVRSGKIKQKDFPLLAVFDGMGGESCGEMAAFLAAESCGEFYKEKRKKSQNIRKSS